MAVISLEISQIRENLALCSGSSKSYCFCSERSLVRSVSRDFRVFIIGISEVVRKLYWLANDRNRPWSSNYFSHLSSISNQEVLPRRHPDQPENDQCYIQH